MMYLYHEDMCISIYRINNNEKTISTLSNLKTDCRLELYFQNVD